MLDNDGCIRQVSDEKSCDDFGPSAQLVQPKTVFAQMSLEKFGIEKQFSEENIFLGMTKKGLAWYWNDNQTVPTASESL